MSSPPAATQSSSLPPPKPRIPTVRYLTHERWELVGWLCVIMEFAQSGLPGWWIVLPQLASLIFLSPILLGQDLIHEIRAINKIVFMSVTPIALILWAFVCWERGILPLASKGWWIALALNLVAAMWQQYYRNQIIEEFVHDLDNHKLRKETYEQQEKKRQEDEDRRYQQQHHQPPNTRPPPPQVPDVMTTLLATEQRLREHGSAVTAAAGVTSPRKQ